MSDFQHECLVDNNVNEIYRSLAVIIRESRAAERNRLKEEVMNAVMIEDERIQNPEGMTTASQILLNRLCLRLEEIFKDQ